MQKRMFSIWLSKHSVIIFSMLLTCSIAKCDNIDSLKSSITEKGKKFIIVSPGYVDIRLDGKQLGYAIASYIDYEYFAYRNFSLIFRIGYNYSYIEHSNEAIDIESGICVRKYFKIKNSSRLFVYSTFNFINHSYRKLSPLENFNAQNGISNSNGIGFHIIPYRKKKNKISRFGVDLSVSLFNNHYRVPSVHRTIGVKYRIN